MPSDNDRYVREKGVPDMAYYFHVIYMRRWILLFIAAAVMFADLIYTFKQTPIYRGTALVLIEKPLYGSESQSVKAGPMPSIGDRDYYSTQYEILKSRMILGRVKDKLKSEKNSGLDQDFSEDELERIITIGAVKNTRLVQVSADHKDPATAAKIANTLVGI